MKKNNPYQETIGCIMYLAQTARPHIAHAVGLMSRFNSSGGFRHVQHVRPNRGPTDKGPHKEDGAALNFSYSTPSVLCI